MAICPECKKQELKYGENLCPHCLNKKTNLWVKAGEAAVAVVTTVAVGIIYAIITKKSPPSA